MLTLTRLQDIDKAYTTLADFMLPSIQNKKKEAKTLIESGNDASSSEENMFSRMVFASELEESTGRGLNDDELVSNHSTTSVFYPLIAYPDRSWYISAEMSLPCCSQDMVSSENFHLTVVKLTTLR